MTRSEDGDQKYNGQTNKNKTPRPTLLTPPRDERRLHVAVRGPRPSEGHDRVAIKQHDGAARHHPTPSPPTLSPPRLSLIYRPPCCSLFETNADVMLLFADLGQVKDTTELRSSNTMAQHATTLPPHPLTPSPPRLPLIYRPPCCSLFETNADVMLLFADLGQVKDTTELRSSNAMAQHTTTLPLTPSPPHPLDSPSYIARRVAACSRRTQTSCCCLRTSAK